MALHTDTDRRYLARAIDLAQRGRGLVSPNPMVGAVLGRDHEILGEGFHANLGGPHAEVEAIKAAGDQDLGGATLYVSLEPCCHHGRTPPCTDAIHEAGIRRVVIASEDPSEHASGRGLGILRDEGVEVVVADGELASRARLLNQPFRKHARTGLPFVTLKMAMSLDGQTATGPADSPWISSEQSRALVHRWRAESDAIAVGIGTALADDPLLTARIPASAVPFPDISRKRNSGAENRQPLRVVFDSAARLPLDSQLLCTLDRAPVLVVTSPAADSAALREAGAEIVAAEGIVAALADLGRRGITSLFLEGGRTLAAAFADAGEIDEARVFVAPILLGEASRLTAVNAAEDTLITTRFKEW